MCEPLKLGDERPFGETTCGFGLTQPECGKPATHHLLWLEDLACSTTCAEHLDYINAKPHPPYEVHSFGGDCGMPGTMWHHPYEDEDEGYCFFPANDDASAMTEAAPMEATHV